jgi:hypothetical protein
MWLQGADPAAAQTPQGVGATRRRGGRWLRPQASVPRGEREEAAAPKGAVADPVDPVNPYPSVATDRADAARRRGRRAATSRDPVATRATATPPRW